MLQPGLFKDKRIIITGAGRGIGAAIASYLLADGACLVAHLGRSGNQDKWTFPLVDNRTNLRTAVADLSTTEGVAEFIALVKSTFDGVDVLINNAGTMLGRVSSSQMTAEHYQRVTDLNVRSVVLLTTGLLPLLKQSSAASIVNVTSISADTGGSAGSSMYSAAKGFISTYTRSLATELAADGIRVNAISPGTVDTDFHQRYSTPEKLAASAAKAPLQRIGTAEDCVPGCLFFCSPECSGFITGQILGINGGTAY